MTENWRKWRWKGISRFSVNGDWKTTKNQTKRQEKNWQHKMGNSKGEEREKKLTTERKKESEARPRKKRNRNEKKKREKRVYSTRYSQAVSPIQVLISPDVAWLRWSDENRYFQRGMAVDIWHNHSHQLIPKSVNTQHQPYFQLYNVHLLLAACQNCLQLASLIEPQNPTIADHFCSTFMQNTKNNVTERPKKFF